MSKSPVINFNDVAGFPMAPEGNSSHYGATLAPLGDLIGAGGLGAMLVRVAPGKRAFPFHNHLGNDEMFVIVAGEGTYRFGEGRHDVCAGSICAAPRGGPDTAHQLINTGSEELVYIAISTKNDPDVFQYPDSGKFGALAIAPGADFMSAHLRYIGYPDSGVDYWDGEIEEEIP